MCIFSVLTLMSVLGPILSYSQCLRSAKGRFPLQSLSWKKLHFFGWSEQPYNFCCCVFFFPVVRLLWKSIFYQSWRVSVDTKQKIQVTILRKYKIQWRRSKKVIFFLFSFQKYSCTHLRHFKIMKMHKT